MTNCRGGTDCWHSRDAFYTRIKDFSDLGIHKMGPSRNNQEWLGGTIFSTVYRASSTFLSCSPLATVPVRVNILDGFLSEPGERQSFSAGSQAAFALTFRCADVRWAAAGLPAEWEWGGCAAQPHPQSGGCFLSALRPHWVPHSLLVLQEGEQVRGVGEVGQKEGSLWWRGDCISAREELSPVGKGFQIKP